MVERICAQVKRDLLQTLADVDRQYKEMLTKYRKEARQLRHPLRPPDPRADGAAQEAAQRSGGPQGQHPRVLPCPVRRVSRMRTSSVDAFSPNISEDGDGPEAKSVFMFDKDDNQVFSVDNKVRESWLIGAESNLAQGKTAQFEMDTVFTPKSVQEDVFNESKDLITSVIDGYNVCIFAYGQVCIACDAAAAADARARRAPARRSRWTGRTRTPA